MGLLWNILKAVFSSKPKASYKVLREKLPFNSETQPNEISEDVLTSRNSVRAVANEISTDTHQVTIQGRCYVVDGDTINIGDASIRLHGIDAPELHHPYGNNAKWALVQLCKGKVVNAVLQGSSSHDRLVASCYLEDGTDLSAEMVKLGMAVDWYKYSGGKYRHLEVPNIRRKLWRCDARQKGRMPAQ